MGQHIAGTLVGPSQSSSEFTILFWWFWFLISIIMKQGYFICDTIDTPYWNNFTKLTPGREGVMQVHLEEHLTNVGLVMTKIVDNFLSLEGECVGATPIGRNIFRDRQTFHVSDDLGLEKTNLEKNMDTVGD